MCPEFPPRPKAVWTQAEIHLSAHAQLPRARHAGGLGLVQMLSPAREASITPGGGQGSLRGAAR